ncbi:MAG: heavy metal translocating P-type ATPase [Desulfobacterales bacterium]|nr:heavy metal translocating P-type ATPase [Desulfobacterales bacterium]
MFFEICLLSCGVYAGAELYKKIRKKYFQKPDPRVAISKNFAVVNKNERNKQLEEILSTDAEHEKNTAMKKAVQDMGISLFSLGTAAGALFYPPLAIISLPGLVYSTFPILKNAFRMLRQGKTGIDTIGAIVATGCIIGGYLIIAAFTAVCYNISAMLLIKVTDSSRNSLTDIFRQHPRFVWVLADGIEVSIPFEELKSGDIIVVSAGEIIPADGVITDGTALIDQHILTGEAMPEEKEVGSVVFASTVVLSGRICVRVEKAGQETAAARIGQILNNTADYKSNTQLRAEMLADKTVLPTLIAGGVSLPFLGAGGALALINTHLKYKLTTVAPISILNYLNQASCNGILIKDGRTLDLLNQVDTIVFDKTGTLTLGQPHVGQIYTCSGYGENEILMYAAAAEYKQTHPIANAILQESEARQLQVPEIEDAEYKIGYGLAVSAGGVIVHAGSIRFMELAGINVPSDMREIWDFCHSQGCSLVLIAIDGKLAGGIELKPAERPEAKEVIKLLQQHQQIKSVYIISGDHEAPTKKLAKDLGIDKYFAETLPESKADIIEQLQNEGRFVCYVGDGINDAIALKKSQVSVSIRGASTAATDTAQIVMMDGSLNQLCQLFDLAHNFQSNMNTTCAVLLTPVFLGMGGVFFLHFGLIHTVILNQVGLLGGISTVMVPWFRYQRQLPESKT